MIKYRANLMIYKPDKNKVDKKNDELKKKELKKHKELKKNKESKKHKTELQSVSYNVLRVYRGRKDENMIANEREEKK